MIKTVMGRYKDTESINIRLPIVRRAAGILSALPSRRQPGVLPYEGFVTTKGDEKDRVAGLVNLTHRASRGPWGTNNNHAVIKWEDIKNAWSVNRHTISPTTIIALSMIWFHHWRRDGPTTFRILAALNRANRVKDIVAASQSTLAWVSQPKEYRHLYRPQYVGPDETSGGPNQRQPRRNSSTTENQHKWTQPQQTQINQWSDECQVDHTRTRTLTMSTASGLQHEWTQNK